MLVISRKKKQSIVIDTGTDKIEIYVQDLYEFNGNQFVKLSLNAPLKYKITRSDYKDESDKKED